MTGILRILFQLCKTSGNFCVFTSFDSQSNPTVFGQAEGFQMKLTQLAEILTWNNIKHQWEYGLLKPFFIWFVWLLFGALYYCFSDKFSFAKAFYYSVSIGYSIGYGVLHDPDSSSRFFSVWHNFIGAVIIAGWVVHFLSWTIDKKAKWHLESYRKLKIDKRANSGREILCIDSTEKAHILVWLAYLVFGVSWSCGRFNWTFSEGLLFASSSLTTGGIFGIPVNSPDGDFVVTALFAMTGVPITAIAIGIIASNIVERTEKKKVDALIHSDLSEEELAVLNTVRDSKSTEEFSKHDYLLLLILRQNAVDVEFVKSAFDAFGRFKKNSDGLVSINGLVEEMGKLRTNDEKTILSEPIENILHNRI